MRSVAKLGLVAVGLGLLVSVTACAVVGNDEESGSSASEIGRRRGHGPGTGRPPGQPIQADEDDASAPAPVDPLTQGIATKDPDGGEAPIATEDGGEPPAPVTEEDAGEAPPPPPSESDNDAG